MEQHSRLPSGDFPYLRASRTNMGLQIHLCESLLPHIRALGEFPVQWVYTRKEVSWFENLQRFFFFLL